MSALTYANLCRHLGSVFRLHAEGDCVPLELIEAADLSGRDANRRPTVRQDPFSLVFRGPRELPVPQGTYRLEHEAVGSLDVFLVPIGPDKEGKGLCLEAVFN